MNDALLIGFLVGWLFLFVCGAWLLGKVAAAVMRARWERGTAHEPHTMRVSGPIKGRRRAK